MKNTTIALTLGLVLSLAGAPAARAMSEFASLSIRPLWPSTPNPGNVLLYEVAVERVGQGMLEINLSCDGLPDGCVATFGDDRIRFTGRDPRYQYFLMTVNCDQPTAVDTYAFTITGTARRQSITIPNPFRLPVRLGAAAPLRAGPGHRLGDQGRAGRSLLGQGRGGAPARGRDEAARQALLPRAPVIPDCFRWH